MRWIFFVALIAATPSVLNAKSIDCGCTKVYGFSLACGISGVIPEGLASEMLVLEANARIVKPASRGKFVNGRCQCNEYFPEEVFGVVKDANGRVLSEFERPHDGEKLEDLKNELGFRAHPAEDGKFFFLSSKKNLGYQCKETVFSRR